MTTYPLATLAPTITSTGISAPAYADIFNSLVASFQSIYGSDVVLTSDSQDGQWIGVIAKAQADTNAVIIADYNSRSPSSAVGAGLSSVVKINGLARNVPTNSTANVTIVGQAGTIITNGLVGDNLNLGTQWALPASVTIPLGGSIVETATCTTQGNVTAASGSLTSILTPTRGWQSVTNAAAAVPGAPVENDAPLRQRQAASTALPAQSVLNAIVAAVANLTGVIAITAHENNTRTTDGLGVPGNSIALVVEGGDAVRIATAIASKKTPGTGTFGTITEVVPDQKGILNTINFSTPTAVPITVVINLHPLTGYVSTTGTALVAATAADISGLGIGQSVYLSKLYSAANLDGNSAGATFNIASILIARSGSPAASDVTIAYNELATCVVGSITLNLV